MASAQVPTTAAGPDIYFIVLDGYARADVLAKYYGFDNGPFLDGLRERGFQVSDASRSKFYWTFLSIGSALNLDYIRRWSAVGLDPGSRDRRERYRILRNNRAAQFLRQRGYRYVHLQSTWGGAASNPYADEFLPCNAGLFGNEYLRAVATRAGCVRWSRRRASISRAATCRTSKRWPRRRGRPDQVRVRPLRAAAPPVSLRSRRHRLRRATISDQFEFQKRLWEDRAAYTGQLAYVNRRIGEVVGRLIDDSAETARDHPRLRPRSEPEETGCMRPSSATSGCRT